ncbi:hypothetical protein SODALDRAFT_330238 [Sodiomyces alkalinus F11]|uniref:Uncharacterized protein n=1 Tax=Sodiomyces alkalinus (strain CBS 110278 / VKM F-3762 / F11) TaxID=1314773 RepID=A0A3N2Q1D3_SODAK|nr:hypothetical protein SODALDRAFT_330238 [Sodiomyces alkalinus F11]ROT40516.1 hypothetical protein SODALDRAFT_330238 [Sodiomyces alkalinus F11]
MIPLRAAFYSAFFFSFCGHYPPPTSDMNAIRLITAAFFVSFVLFDGRGRYPKFYTLIKRFGREFGSLGTKKTREVWPKRRYHNPISP